MAAGSVLLGVATSVELEAAEELVALAVILVDTGPDTLLPAAAFFSSSPVSTSEGRRKDVPPRSTPTSVGVDALKMGSRGPADVVEGRLESAPSLPSIL